MDSLKEAEKEPLMKKLLLPAALLTAALGVFAQSSQMKESIIGCWTMPSRAGEALQLNRSGNFSFQDYNAKTKAFESLHGTWKMNGKTLMLLYNDRPDQTFMLAKNETGWVLSKAGGFKFMKAQPGDCVENQQIYLKI